jgi:hypothetical protein
VKFQVKDQYLFDKVFGYIRQYYWEGMVHLLIKNAGRRKLIAENHRDFRLARADGDRWTTVLPICRDYSHSSTTRVGEVAPAVHHASRRAGTGDAFEIRPLIGSDGIAYQNVEVTMSSGGRGADFVADWEGVV